MSDAATPVNPAPAAPAPAPATAATPAPTEDKVILTKEQFDQLQRDAARARAMQRQNDRNKSSHFTPESQAPKPAPTQEQLAERAADEDRKAERGLMGIAASPEYREVLDADPTLRAMFVQNPLSVLGLMAPDAFDAEDALTLVKEKLEEKKAKLAKSATLAPAPAAPAPASPAPGAVAPSDTAPNAEYEQAKKNPNPEGAIAGMITARMKANKK